MATVRVLLPVILLLVLAQPMAHAQQGESPRGRWGERGGGRGGWGGERGERGSDEQRGGQQRGSERERGRGGWGGRRGGFNPAGFLQRLDTNGDGKIEPSEVPERMRPFIQRLGERYGFDPEKPFSLEVLQQEPASDNQQSSGEKKPSESAQKNSSEPLVPGFGVEIDLPPVPGFDVSLDTEEEQNSTNENRSRSESSPDDRRREGDSRPREQSSQPSSSSSSSSEGSSAESAAEQEQRQARYRRYAESMVRQYDTNGDGKLQREEWRKMRGDPEKADLNGDGIITVDELASQLGSYSERRSDESSSWGGSRDSGTSESQPGSAQSSSRDTPVRRFLTPAERLPEGLPDWFLRKDLDGDGQIMMHEYTDEWSEEKAAEFARYDRNGDGIITAEEALNPGPSSTASSSSRSDSSTSSSGTPSRSESRSGYGSRSGSDSEARGSSRFGSGSPGRFGSEGTRGFGMSRDRRSR